MHKSEFLHCLSSSFSFSPHGVLPPDRKMLGSWTASHKPNYKWAEKGKKRQNSTILWAENLICPMPMFSLWYNSYQLVFMKLKGVSTRKPQTSHNRVDHYLPHPAGACCNTSCISWQLDFSLIPHRSLCKPEKRDVHRMKLRCGVRKATPVPRFHFLKRGCDCSCLASDLCSGRVLNMEEMTKLLHQSQDPLVFTGKRRKSTNLLVWCCLSGFYFWPHKNYARFLSMHFFSFHFFSVAAARGGFSLWC